MSKNPAIRDPVHDYIRLTPEELTLIDTPFVQRLRWISQLSGVRLVFPGAQHSRISHVMGVMHLAGLYAGRVYQDDDERDFNMQLARLSGLLHDIGHGPFSHAYDDTVYRDIYPGNPHGHDTHRMKIIESDLLKPYIENCGIETKDLRDLWTGEKPVLQAVVQGALGADRMDFMLRDAYYSGTSQFGVIASERLIDNSLIKKHDGVDALHYKFKVLEDIFQSLLGRFYMYRAVYFHKTSAAADILIRKLLLASKGPLDLAARTEDLESYQWINEYTLIGEIMSSKSPELDEAKRFTKRLLARQLPKLVWEATLPESNVKAITGNLETDSLTIANGQFIDKVKNEAVRLKKSVPQLHVTHTYPMSTIDTKEFDVGNIYIWDEKNTLGKGKKSYTLHEAINNTAYFRSFLSQIDTARERYVMIRVFADAEDADWIKEFAESQQQQDTGPTIAETSY